MFWYWVWHFSVLFHHHQRSPASSLLFCLSPFKVSNAWPPAMFAVSTEESSCGLLENIECCAGHAGSSRCFFALLFVWHVAVSYHHMDFVCRCSSRRFSCTFSRRPRAPTTTSGWSYKPSLEYVQVCVLISLKGNWPLKGSECDT